MKIRQGFAVSADSAQAAIRSPNVPKIGERFIVVDAKALPMENSDSTWAVTIEYEVDDGC